MWRNEKSESLSYRGQHLERANKTTRHTSYQNIGVLIILTFKDLTLSSKSEMQNALQNSSIILSF